jgi:class 3 adenylate cyclase
MVEVPRTHYVKTGDLHLAYHVSGDAPLNLLSSTYFPIDCLDEEPSIARFQRRLASFSRLVQFNPRGLGLSDPVSPSSPPTLEQWMRDALAVMDAVGIARAAVFTSGWVALEGSLLAATHPDRVSHLIVVNGAARLLRAPEYPIGMSRDEWDAYEEVVFEPDAVERGLDVLALANPSVADDPAYRAWWDRAGNRGASPAMAQAITRLRRQADVRPLLGSIQTPTLILHRRDISGFFPVQHGRYLAEHIPNAKYVELDGADTSCWVGDTDLMLDEIEEFLTGVRHGPEPDRALAAVLFTDIVASTERIVEVGERRWRDLLDRHDAVLRRQLERFGGREIKTTGDGVLATFDGPARAVQCACAIRDAAAQLGLEVRAGVHVGEVELRGPDIAGMTVHIAARIHARADPGEVLVSRTVVDLVTGSHITFTDRGQHELKGVPGNWQLFGVTQT